MRFYYRWYPDRNVRSYISKTRGSATITGNSLRASWWRRRRLRPRVRPTDTFPRSLSPRVTRPTFFGADSFQLFNHQSDRSTNNKIIPQIILPPVPLTRERESLCAYVCERERETVCQVLLTLVSKQQVGRRYYRTMRPDRRTLRLVSSRYPDNGEDNAACSRLPRTCTRVVSTGQPSPDCSGSLSVARAIAEKRKERNHVAQHRPAIVWCSLSRSSLEACDIPPVGSPRGRSGISASALGGDS